jgi:hypothetical protein
MFPVFEDGEPERELTPRGPDGFQPRGSGAAMDSEFFHLRDPAALEAEKQRKLDEAFRAVNPALHDARQALQRSMRTAAHWLTAVNDARRVVAQKVSSLHGTSADGPIGVKWQRQHELHAAQDQLAEAEQEYAAALEELEAAKAAVAALAVTP